MGICLSSKNSEEGSNKEKNNKLNSPEEPFSNTRHEKKLRRPANQKTPKRSHMKNKKDKNSAMRSTLRNKKEERDKICSKYKEIGNKFFREGSYNEAILNYSEAIVKITRI